MRWIHKYLKPPWWVTPNSFYYGIFFPHWNGAFQWKPSLLLSLLCPADQPGAHQAQPVWRTLVWPGPDMDRQLSLQQTCLVSSSARISPSSGERAGPFFNSTRVYMSKISVGFEADHPMLRLVLLLLNQRQSFTPRRQRQKRPVNLQLPVAFSKSFMKLFILQLFPTKKG